jgi:hypothetical protein
MTKPDPSPSADQRQARRRRNPDGSDPEFEDDLEDLEYLFQALRRLTY